MDDPNYSNISKFHLGQVVTRRMDRSIPKERAQVVSVTFMLGGTVKYELSWDDGNGGTGFEQELLAVDEREILLHK
jgi:hypothetical protein